MSHRYPALSPPLPACLLPPGGPYGNADLMSRQLEVLRVINADQRPLRRRGCEWVLKDCEGQLWKDCASSQTNTHCTHAPGVRIGDISWLKSRLSEGCSTSKISSRFFLLFFFVQEQFREHEISTNLCPSVHLLYGTTFWEPPKACWDSDNPWSPCLALSHCFYYNEIHSALAGQCMNV